MVIRSMLFGALLASGLGLTTKSNAEEHLVIVTGFSYFPETIFVQPGDTVLFINKSGSDQIVVGRGGDWVVGPIANDSEAALKVTEDTSLDYFSAYRQVTPVSAAGRTAPFPDADAGFGSFDEAPIRALISFDPPPLG